MTEDEILDWHDVNVLLPLWRADTLSSLDRAALEATVELRLLTVCGVTRDWVEEVLDRRVEAMCTPHGSLVPPLVAATPEELSAEY